VLKLLLELRDLLLSFPYVWDLILVGDLFLSKFLSLLFLVNMAKRHLQVEGYLFLFPDLLGKFELALDLTIQRVLKHFLLGPLHIQNLLLSRFGVGRVAIWAVEMRNLLFKSFCFISCLRLCTHLVLDNLTVGGSHLLNALPVLLGLLIMFVIELFSFFSNSIRL
jgi:hypothetical protein